MATDFKLSTEEKTTIQRNRKPEGQLPTYFDASTEDLGGGDTVISRDFEAFLLTKSVSDLQAATKWLDEARKLNKPRRDRDAILLDTLIGLSTQTESQLAELDSVLGTFKEFEQTFPDTRFLDVLEVAKIKNDMRSVIGEQISKRDQAFYMQTFLGLLLKAATASQVSANLERELESWAGPLSAYITRTP